MTAEPPGGRSWLGRGVQVALFFVVIATLGWLSNLAPGRRLVVAPLTRVSVDASRLLINAFGGQARSAGTLLLGPGLALDVKDGCNGVIAMILFTGAVLAHAAPAGWKLLGLTLGLPAIWLINLLRIVMLYLVTLVSPAQVEFFHVYFWQTLIIICVAALWYVWALAGLRREAGSRESPAPPAG